MESNYTVTKRSSSECINSTQCFAIAVDTPTSSPNRSDVRCFKRPRTAKMPSVIRGFPVRSTVIVSSRDAFSVKKSARHHHYCSWSSVVHLPLSYTRCVCQSVKRHIYRASRARPRQRAQHQRQPRPQAPAAHASLIAIDMSPAMASLPQASHLLQFRNNRELCDLIFFFVGFFFGDDFFGVVFFLADGMFKVHTFLDLE